MTINEKIREALDPFGDPVVPELYTGEKETYYTFNYELVPFQFADNRPTWWKALAQVHFFCPLAANSIHRRRDTVTALVRAGFTWPEVVDASAQDVQHFVFETEILTEIEKG